MKEKREEEREGPKKQKSGGDGEGGRKERGIQRR